MPGEFDAVLEAEGLKPKAPFDAILEHEGIRRPLAPGPFDHALAQEGLGDHIAGPGTMVPPVGGIPSSIDHPWPNTVKPFGGALGPTATRMLEPEAPRFSPEEIPNPMLRAGANVPQSVLGLAQSASPPEMARVLEHPVDAAKGIAEWVWKSVRATGNSAVSTLAQVFSPRLHEILAAHGISGDEFEQLFSEDPAGTVAGILAPIEAAGHLPSVMEKARQIGAAPPKMEQAPPGPPTIPREGTAVVPEAAPAPPVAPEVRHRAEIADLAGLDQRLQRAIETTKPIVAERIPPVEAPPPAEPRTAIEREIPPASEASPARAEAVPTMPPPVTATPTEAAAGPTFRGIMFGAKGKMVDTYDLPDGFHPEITTRKAVTGDTLRAAGLEIQPTAEQIASEVQKNAAKSGKFKPPVETVEKGPAGAVSERVSPPRDVVGATEARPAPPAEPGVNLPSEPPTVEKKIRMRSKVGLPDVNPHEDLRPVLRHLAEAQGLAPTPESRKFAENYGTPGLIKKGGMEADAFASWLEQNYPGFVKPGEGMDLVDVAGRDYREKTGAGTTERRSPDRWKRTEEKIRARAQELGIDPDQAVEAAQTLRAESLDEADISPGDVIHAKGDLYRAQEREGGGIRLRDGDTIELKPGEEIQGSRVGAVTESERVSSPSAAVRPTAGQPPAGTAPREVSLPGFEDATASHDAHEEGVAKLAEQDAAIEKKRAAAERTGQGSLLDQEANARIAKEKAARDQEARDEAAQGNIFQTEEEIDAAREAIRQKAKKKGPKLYAGLDPIEAVRELIDLSRHVAETLARAAKDGRAKFTDWHREMRAELQALGGIELSRDKFERLWGQNIVRHAAYLRHATAGLPPGVHGKLKVFMREAGIRGQIAFDLWRRGQNRVSLGKKLLAEDSKKMFKGLDQPAKDAMAVTLAGIRRRDTGGGYHYGSLGRAGVERAYVGGSRMLPKPGTLLPDGRFVGFDQPNGKDAQLYRVIWPDEAYKVHQALKKSYPEAARVMDEILAIDEPPVVTAGGDRLPSRSRVVLKRDWKIEGLEADEALDAQALAAKAYLRQGGLPGAQTVIHNEFSWVPESATDGRTFTGRVRNVLRGMTANARKYKSGAIAEQVRKGLASVDIEKGLKRTRQELLAEAVSHEVAKGVLALVAEPIKNGETLESIAASNYRPFSKTGLYAGSVGFRRFMAKHADWFEGQGIDVPEVMRASHLAGGKGHKIPSELLDMLAPAWGEAKGSTNPQHVAFWKAMDKLGANVVGSINVWRLTRVSTAARNLVSNQIVYTSKLMRDFYEDALRLAFRDPQAFAAPFVNSIADVRALGTSMGKKARKRLPAEMLGSTWLDEAEKAGGIAAAGGKILRYTGFNLADIYTKRLITEAVVDASARQAWAESGRQGSKKAFVDKFKDSVPPEIESLAYREMDTWGGYDYGNVHPKIEALKRSAVGRAIVPYPTYYYKLLNTYMELTHPQNVTRAIGLGKASKRQRIRAAANLLSFGTLATIAWGLTNDDGDLPDELTEQDLPLEVQKFGRVKVASLDKEGKDGLWVRLYDMPFLGEVMAAKAIWKGEMNVGDYINDRLALGPLFNVVAISAGLTNRYNKDMPVGAAMGREVSSWFPFAAELGTVRRLTDPLKRKGYDEEDRSYWRNFARGFAENYPILSTLLEPRVSTVRLKASTYRPSETWLSYGLLNTHFINEDERQIAIKLAEASKLDMRLQNLTDDTIRAAVLSTMDSEGWTLAGRIKRAGKTDSVEAGIDRAKKLWQADVLIAYKDGGYEKALAKAKEIRDAHRDEIEWRGSAEPIEHLLKRLEVLDKAGLAYREFEKAPADTQKEFKESVKQDIERRGKIRLKRAQ